MFNECLYIWKLLNFYKYNTALYEIFSNEPLTQCVLIFMNWTLSGRLRELKMKTKVNPKSGRGPLRERSLTRAFPYKV